MFLTIFKQELKYWFNRPAFYIYLSIFLTLSFFLSATSAGFFDSIVATTGSSRIVNSPIGISGILSSLTIFIFFLFPSIVGVSIYRDYKTDMHTILYSYPFTKSNYLFAKFLSSICIVSLIVLGIAFGMMIGFRFPGTNQDLVGPFNMVSYLQTYFVFILPNVLLFGAIVFAVVTFSRNIAAGFIAVIILMFGQAVLASVLSEPEHRTLAAILDPFGDAAANYYTKYWTMSEQNELQIPIKEMIIYNRLLWLAISSLIFGLVYKFFAFSQNAISISFKKNQGNRVVKTNFSGITKIVLPKISYDFSFKENLKTTWRLSNIDFKYIFKSWPFISIVLVGLLLLIVTLFNIGEIFGTKTLPVTWQMLGGGRIFGRLAINICTFLYAGMLVHRASIARLHHLVDITPVPNWVLLVSKVIALIKMQLVLLSVIMLSGILFQAYKGYYNFEIAHYIKELFFLDFLNLLVWAFLSIFIQTLMRNPYLGLFVLLVISIGTPFLTFAGIEQDIFKFNEGPGYNYSDMNGYGILTPYLAYKTYWLLSGLAMLVVAFLFWVRGIPSSFLERIAIAKTRFKGKVVVGFAIFFIAFIALGFSIYQETGTKNKKTSSKQAELNAVDWEKKYKKYENYSQPRVVAVKAGVDIFPKKRLYKATATFTLVNKTNETIDSVFLNHNSLKNTFTFNRPNTLVLEDTIQHFDIYKFDKPIFPGDSLELSIVTESNKNTNFRKRSPIRENGTFLNNKSLFPSLGYTSQGELTDNKTREKYDLPPNNLRPHPSDSTALGNTYISKDSDWIDFEATVSTSKDQIAIAPGYLQKEWLEEDRRYFHYKMDSKILNFYAFNSARYEVKKELWKGISLEIYYHKGHEYNLDRMLKGMKASLAYNADNFSPYQHRQARIIEFPRTAGSFAQAFANTIPFSEGVGFIADVDDKCDGVDYPFAITAHEIAHQWWAHQVIGADVLGASMLSESLSEYVSLKVLEHQHGKEKMRTFLKEALDGYLLQRTLETKREKPLLYNDGQGYIHYQKGSMVFYALSDYIGENQLNGALKKYLNKVKFQESPYTTSIELLNYISEVTPDSLQYVLKDMFETITLYKNKIVDAEVRELDNGKFKVDIEFQVSKYRNNEKGKRFYGDKVGDTLTYKTEKMRKPILSVFLEDYIDIGIFTEEEVDGELQEKTLYLQKHKITQINNKISIVVEKKPKEVGVDPYNKLIDTNSDDNRKKL